MSSKSKKSKTTLLSVGVEAKPYIPLDVVMKQYSHDVNPTVYEMSSGLRTTGSKATTKFEPYGELRSMINEVITNSVTLRNPFFMRIKARFMSETEFLNNHASGTLRKNARVGFDYKKQLLHERIAFDFGYAFEAIHESHVNWGSPLTEGDCHAITEAGWHIDRYQFLAFPGDEFEAKYLKIHTGHGPDREGIGIIIRKTSAPYIPNNYVVFSIIAEVDLNKHDYMNAVNPC